jgi:predicted RND superfamily exporter protein
VLRAAFAAYIDWLLNHPRLVLATLLAVTAFWASQLPGLRVEIDPDASLPQNHPYIRALKILETKFGEKNLLLIGLFPTDGNVFSPAFLSKVERITNRIRDLPGLVRASYLGLGTPLAKSVEGKGDTLLVRPLLERAPTTEDEAREVRRRAFLNPFYRGIIVSDDARATAIIANFRLTSEMRGYPEIHDAVARVLDEEADGTFTARLGGPIAILAALAKVTEKTVLLFPLAMLVIALIHYEAFRTLQGMILPLVTALLAVVWSLGLMGFLRLPLDPFNTTTPILILAVAAGHAVQILKRYYEEYERYQDSRRATTVAMLRLGPVMVTAGAVAALSFFSLAVFATTNIRNFGLLTGFGILSAMVIELTLIPAIRVMLPAPRTAETEREALSGRILERALGRVARLVADHPLVVAEASLAVMVIAVFGATRIHVDTAFKRQFHPSEPVRLDDTALNSAFAGTNTLVFVVSGPADGALEEPAALQAMRDLQTFVEHDPRVGRTSSVADLIVEMNKALHGGDVKEAVIPASRNLIGQYFFLYSLSGSPEDLDSQIDEAHRTAPIRTFMKDDSTEYAQALIANVQDFVSRSFPPGYTVSYSGSNASNAALTEVLVRGKLLNMLQISGIITLISGIMLRSVVGGLLVAAPLLMAVLVNLGVMGFTGVPLDIVTAPIAAMAVGIGADYAIYFIFRFREELATSSSPELALASALRTSGKAIVYVSSAIAGGYLVLCVSGFVFHRELGIMVALAMIVSSAASISFLPALILIGRPGFLYARQRPGVLRTGASSA